MKYLMPLFLALLASAPARAQSADVIPACSWISDSSFHLKSLQKSLNEVKQSYQTMIDLRKPCQDDTQKLINVCVSMTDGGKKNDADTVRQFASLRDSAGKECSQHRNAANNVYGGSEQIANVLKKMQDDSACGPQLMKLQSSIFPQSGDNPQDLMTRFQLTISGTCSGSGN